MAKRGLSLLLALVTLFSLSVPAFSEEEVVAAEEVVTEEPVEAAEEVVVETEKEPVVEPEVTEEPVVEPEEAPEAEEPEAEPAPAEESGECGEGVSYTLTEDGVLTITGSGEISPWAFNTRSEVKNVVIDDGVIGIDYSAFQDCTSLESVTIPESVTSIGCNAFSGCSSLESVTILNRECKIDEGSDTLGRRPVIIGYYGSTAQAYAERNYCTFQPVNKDYCGAEGDGANVTWALSADGVLTISGTGKMRDYSSSVVRAPWSDLQDQIKAVVVQDGVTSIGDNAFQYYSSLRSVSAGESLVEVGAQAFYGTPVTSVELPGVTSLGGGAFQQCGSLTSITLPKVERLNGYTFGFCRSLTSISFPEVTSIGDDEFVGCEQLTSVDMPKVVSIGSRAFSSCAIESISLPKVESLGGDVFTGCANLKTVDIPEIVSIGARAFAGCEKLTTVTLSSRLVSVGENAFLNCGRLTSADMADTLTSIGASAFSGCASLRRTNLAPGVTRIENDTYNGCGRLTKLDLPVGLTYIGDRAFQGTSITTLVIPDGVNHIGENAFNGCTTKEITLPAGITSVSDSLLAGADKLEKVTIPNGVTEIEPYAFQNCAALKNINVPDSVTTIGDFAFSGCAALASFRIPNKVTVIREGTFSGCTALSDVTVPGGVTTIEDWAFESCTGLAGISLPNSVTSIGKQSFDGCRKLTVMKIPERVNAIGPNAFAGCAMTDVTVPGNVATIGGSAFGNGAVEDIYVENPDCVIEEPTYRDELSVSPVQTAAAPVKAAAASWLGGTLGTPGKTVVHGHVGSTAEAHAKAHGYEFMDINIVVTPKPTATPKPQATAVPTLSVPTVTIAQVADGIKVSWNAVAGSPRYMVYYKENNSGWKQIGTTTSTTYTRAAKYLKSGAKYQFTVRCCANDKKTMLSGYTASNSLTYGSTAQLAAPTVTIAKAADGIKVTWNKIDGAPRYMVYYKENNGGWKQIGTTTATTYTRKAANLKSGAKYQFTVRCCANDKKTMLGPYKASNSLTYTATAQLAAPTVKIAKVATGIKVSWNKIAGSPRYMVYYKEGNGGWVKIGTTTATSYTRAAKYLKNGVTYQFTVRCCENDKKTMLGPYKASNGFKYTK